MFKWYSALIVLFCCETVARLNALHPMIDTPEQSYIPLPIVCNHFSKAETPEVLTFPSKKDYSVNEVYDLVFSGPDSVHRVVKFGVAGVKGPDVMVEGEHLYGVRFWNIKSQNEGLSRLRSYAWIGEVRAVSQ